MKELFVVKWSFLIPLLPLLGAVIAGFACTGRRKKLAHWPIWLTVGAAAVMAITLLFQTIGLVNNAHSAAPDATAHVTHDAAAVTTTPINGELSAVRHFYTWIEAGSFVVNAGFYFDTLTVVMLCVICGIGFFITVFAKGYMLGEEGYFRFFAYLGLFIFAMTILVLGENLILLYLGWEGVGLCSYLLIGYYYDKPAAREAAKKAFLVNRIGDFGFGLGIMLSFLAFGTVSYFGPVAGAGGDGLLELAAGSLTPFQQTAMDWIPFLLMIGAFGKSAQFPLYVWLPDAMEGPTPVSALIHAATMVTAGVYMIARCGVLFVSNDAAMLTIACVGAFTAIFAASIALRQFDLKKVFAYSTVSQLGFMFVAVGCLAPVAGVFHLITHAFFKALLFLSSGVVMHAMLGHLDMRRMSGLKRVLPLTRWLILIGCLALAGFPLLSGFFSKDEIVAAAWHRAPLLGIIMLVTAFMTAYYTFRLYFRVFEGPELVPTEPAEGHHGGGHDDHGHDAHGHDAHGHGDHAHHNHEPAVMMIPLIVLAIGALFAGYLNFPKHALGDFLGSSPSFIMAYDHAAAHYNPTAVDEAHVVNPVVFGQTDTRSHEIQEQEHHSHWNFMVGSGVISIVGIGLAFVLHLKQRALSDKIARSFTAVTSAMENKFWVDELYDAVIVNPLRQFGRILFMIDRIVVDGIVWLIGFIPQFTGFVLRLTAQNGYLQGYALQMVIGIAVILLLVFVSF